MDRIQMTIDKKTCTECVCRHACVSMHATPNPSQGIASPLCPFHVQRGYPKKVNHDALKPPLFNRGVEAQFKGAIGWQRVRMCHVVQNGPTAFI
mmetsp:Transcript_104183/g.179523  ORF Transcript_104183/g.179523 Transcript_104183/m.179523 type:complete len:94 (-) Transcript_104183:567-848(-)